jgi:LacI family transcriptional regulator
MSKRSPTVIDVAKAAGVSIATVSRALNGGKVSLRAKAKVDEAIRTLGYRRNSLARSLVTGRSGVVGVLIPDVMGPLYAQIARGIEDVLGSMGMHFIVITDNRSVRQERKAIEILLGRRVDGLVLIGSRLSAAELSRLAGEVPVVHVQRESEDEGDAPIVVLDNHGGTCAALNHLYDCGHRAIAHVTGVRRDGQERKESYLAFMQGRGLTPILVPGDSTEAGGEAAAQALLASSVSAVYCTNDRTAAGLYRALKARSVRVPQELSIVGFDDLPWVQYLDPPLTTVRQDGREMGRVAARRALAAIAGDQRPDTLKVGAALVVRASVARLVPKEVMSQETAAPSPQSG